MLHSDLRNRGKNILLLQKKHMMTKLSGCHTGFCIGGGKLVYLATLNFETHTALMDMPM